MLLFCSQISCFDKITEVLSVIDRENNSVWSIIVPTKILWIYEIHWLPGYPAFILCYQNKPTNKKLLSVKQ